MTHENCDLALIDVLDADPNHEPERGLTFCRLIQESDWGKTHPLIVWTAFPRHEFMKLARELDVDADRIQFYSKLEMEIPPAVECIRQNIIQSPRLIGLEPRIPKAITRDWIEQQPSVYGYLAEYVVDKVCETTEDAALVTMPRGLHWIWYLVRFESEIGNGGFHQFFANGTSPDGRDEYGMVALDAARQMGIHQLVPLIESGLRIWRRHSGKFPVKDNQLMNPAQAVAAENEFDNEVIPELERLDQEFYDLEETWVGAIDSYVKKHPEEFIHSAPSQVIEE
jgi:hypothetical protein